MSLKKLPGFLLDFSVDDMERKANRSYRFKSFRLDVAERKLLHHDSPVPLTPKAFDVLVILVEQSGHLIEKDDLLKQVWTDSFVEEANIARVIHTLRRALGEDEDGNKFIETVATKGYRFVAKVTEERKPTERRSDKSERVQLSDAEFPKTINVEEESDQDGQVATTGQLIKAYRPKRIVFFTVGFSTAIALILLLSFNFWSRSAVEPAARKSIAVLPLIPINTAARSELYEVGIVDSLVQKLSSLKGLIVRPVSATRKYAEIDQDPLAAGREQKVDYVLASNYQLADGWIRITSQLINVGTGQVDETYQFDKEATGVFAIQDSIVAQVGNKLIARFPGSNTGSAPKPGTTNEEAYRLYLLAMNMGEERGIQNLQRSLDHLERAVLIDRNYALAWAAIAHIHTDMVGHTDSGQNEHYLRSMEAIEKARAIDPNISEAYSALCINKNRYEYDVSGAETACKRAVELDPNSPVARKTYAKFLYTRGHFDEAIVEIKKAMELQPVSYRNQQIYALTLYYARRYDEAAGQFDRLIELNPNQSNFVQDWNIKILEAQGKESEAFESLVKMLNSRKIDDATLDRIKAAYRRSGWRGVILEQIKTAEADSAPSNFGLACLNAKIENKDKAFEYLEKAYQEHSFQIAILQVEPQLGSLRNDPRFDDLVRRVGMH